jgi:hypothetical protein
LNDDHPGWIAATPRSRQIGPSTVVATTVLIPNGEQIPFATVDKVSLPRTVTQQPRMGTPIWLDEAEPGIDQLNEFAQGFWSGLESLRWHESLDFVEELGETIAYGADVAPGRSFAHATTQMLELALVFRLLWRQVFDEDPPTPSESGEDDDSYNTILIQVIRTWNTHLDRILFEAWWYSPSWASGLSTALARRDLRQSLPERARLTAAVDALKDVLDLTLLDERLSILDNESLMVVDRAGGRGYRFTVSGVTDNLQLLTLIAATLSGDPAQGLLPGTPPLVPCAGKADGQALHDVERHLTLTDGFGNPLPTAGRPSDIPYHHGERTILIEPSRVAGTWDLHPPWQVASEVSLVSIVDPGDKRLPTTLDPSPPTGSSVHSVGLIERCQEWEQAVRRGAGLGASEAEISSLLKNADWGELNDAAVAVGGWISPGNSLDCVDAGAKLLAIFIKHGANPAILAGFERQVAGTLEYSAASAQLWEQVMVRSRQTACAPPVPFPHSGTEKSTTLTSGIEIWDSAYMRAVFSTWAEAASTVSTLNAILEHEVVRRGLTERQRLIAAARRAQHVPGTGQMLDLLHRPS